MKKTNHTPPQYGFLIAWLGYVGASYLLPWFGKVYFLWDDVEFLMRLRAPDLREFFRPHQYQFHPLFNGYYWTLIQLFGVSPKAFFVASVSIHLLNISLVYLLITRITKSSLLSKIAAVLVSFNKSYYTVVFWPSIHSNIILTTFLLVATLLFVRMEKEYHVISVFLISILLFLGSVSQGFGVGSGLVFALIALIFWKKGRSRTVTTIGAAVSGFASILTLIPFSVPQIQEDRVFTFSLSRLLNLLYFTAVGPSQAVINRFFLPGFIPNIHSIPNIAVMILLPTIVLLLVLATILRSLRAGLFRKIWPFFLFGSFTVVPYFIASLVRSAYGALGGIAERYIYPPFFFFILMLTYCIFLASQFHSAQRKKIFKVLVLGFTLILSLGQQIVMHLEVYHLFR